jgi:hypothetical protein
MGRRRKDDQNSELGNNEVNRAMSIAFGAGAEPAASEMRLLRRLEHLRIRAGETTDPGAVSEGFAATFRALGFDIESNDLDEAAFRLRARRKPSETIGALDGWLRAVRMAGESTADTGQRLLGVVLAADRDVVRGRIRTALSLGDLEDLRAIAAETEASPLPPRTRHLLGVALADLGDPRTAARVLRAAQIEHPESFWINLDLAWLLQTDPEAGGEAARFATAAVALRPGSAGAWRRLAVLQHLADDPQAAASLRKAAELEREEEPPQPET